MKTVVLSCLFIKNKWKSPHRRSKSTNIHENRRTVVFLIKHEWKSLCSRSNSMRINEKPFAYRVFSIRTQWKMLKCLPPVRPSAQAGPGRTYIHTLPIDRHGPLLLALGNIASAIWLVIVIWVGFGANAESMISKLCHRSIDSQTNVLVIDAIETTKMYLWMKFANGKGVGCPPLK